MTARLVKDGEEPKPAEPETIAESIDAQLIRLAADHAVHAHDALMKSNFRLVDANLGIAKGLMMAREVIGKPPLAHEPKAV